MTRASRPFDFSGRDELLRDPENAAIYLADFLETGDIELFQEALKDVAKAQQGGLAAVAEQAQLNRGSLYKSPSKTGKPQLDTVLKMLSAMGLEFRIAPAHHKDINA